MGRADEMSRALAAATREEPEALARLGGSRSPPGRLLGNGDFLTLVTEAGTGGAWLGSLALTRWRGDRVEDGDGCFVYVRETDGRFTSIGARPAAGRPERYETAHGPGWLAITREERGLESAMEIWVDARLACECRRITLRNRSPRPRAIEITTWVEVALDDARGFEAHPAYSRLFLQTEAVAGAGMLLARRRARAPDATSPWLGHALLGPGVAEFETDRARFVGRGRDAAQPRALVTPGPLSGTAGSVLDPVLCVRRNVTIAPGAAEEFVFVLAAALSREGTIAILERMRDSAAVRASREAAEAAARERARRHGLDEGEALELERLGAALRYGDPRLLPARANGAGAPAPQAPARLAHPAGAPLVLIEDADRGPAWKQARAAWGYWRDLGMWTAVIGLGRGASPSTGNGAGKEEPALVARATLTATERRALVNVRKYGDE